jgi:lactoylglutathione lyase
VNTVKATLKNAWPYQQDKMNLPVPNVDDAVPFYESKLGFKLVSTETGPHKRAILERDDVQIGLAENGGDPSQDGSFIEVDNVENALQEFKANGLQLSGIQAQNHGATKWRVFFVVAPDGLCYCFGEKQL